MNPPKTPAQYRKWNPNRVGPHYNTGLGDGNVHGRMFEQRLRKIDQGLPRSIREPNNQHVRTRDESRKKDDVPEREPRDDALVLYQKKLERAKEIEQQAMSNSLPFLHDHFVTVTRTSDRPWQITVIGLLAIIGVLVVLFLHLIRDPVQQKGTYRRTRARRQISMTGPKKKTDAWNEDEFPDGQYPADNEAPSRPGEVLYYHPHRHNVHRYSYPQPQHRQRKNTMECKSPDKSKESVVVNSRPYYHRTSPPASGVGSRRVAPNPPASIHQESTLTRSPKNYPPGGSVPVNVVSQQQQMPQQTTLETTTSKSPLRGRLDARPAAEGFNDAVLGSGLEDFGDGLDLDVATGKTGDVSDADSEALPRPHSGDSQRRGSGLSESPSTPEGPTSAIDSNLMKRPDAPSSPSSFESFDSESPERRASKRSGETAGTGQFSFAPISSPWGDSSDEEMGSVGVPQHVEDPPDIPLPASADFNEPYSPTGLKRRHGGVETPIPRSSLLLSPGHEDMVTPRAQPNKSKKVFMVAARDGSGVRQRDSSDPGSLTPPHLSDAGPPQDKAAVDRPRAHAKAEVGQSGGAAASTAAVGTPDLFGGIQLPLLPTLDHQAAPRSVCVEELHLVHLAAGNMRDGQGSRWGTAVDSVTTKKTESDDAKKLVTPPSPPVHKAHVGRKHGPVHEETEPVRRKSSTPEATDDHGPRNAIKHKRKDLTHATDATSSLTSPIKFSELKLGDIIGGGGFGQVWRATWRGTPVAVKILTGSAQTDVPKSILEEFAAEINMVSGMRHPNICLYMGACLDPPNRAIVTELAANGSLWDALRQPLSPPFVEADGIRRNAWPLTLYQSSVPRTAPLEADRNLGAGVSQHVINPSYPSPPVPPAGTWPWVLVKRVASGAARGMTYLHSGNPPVLHRDLKSANLLLDDSYTAKVTDFGLSRLKAQERSMTGNCGTVQWMAPEVLANQRYAEPADVYSFGIILWELLSGECPYEGMSPIQCALAVLNKDARPEIPAWCPDPFAALIKACQDKNPLSRPTFSQIISALDAMP